MKRVAFVGQAMPKPPFPDKPFGRTHLYKWFEAVGISEEIINTQFFFAAVVSYFPGAVKGKGHLVPTPAEIEAERPVLKKFLDDTSPDIIVPIGKISIQEALNVKNPLMHEYIGKSFTGKPFNLMAEEKLIIPLPHPSGASTWFFKEENKVLLQEALRLLKENL
jgi:uracil-DNA glycosylase